MAFSLKPQHTAVLGAFLALLAATNLYASDAEAISDEMTAELKRFITSGDADQQIRAIETIGTSCDPQWGTATLLEAKTLDSEDDRIVARTLEALGELGGEGAAAALVKKSLTLVDADAYMAGAAGLGLASLLYSHPEASSEVAGACTQLAGHKEALVRMTIASALGRLSDGAGVATLVTMLESDASPAVQRAAAANLSLHADGAAAADALIAQAGAEKLRSLDAGVAQMVVRALGFVRGEKRDAAMSAAMSAISHADGGVREGATFAAYLLSTKENAREHQPTLETRVGTVAGGGSAGEELVRLESLSLHLALLTGEYGFIDKGRYPQLFPEQDTVALEQSQAALQKLEGVLVSDAAAPVVFPAYDPAAGRARAALEELRSSATLLVMEAAHFKAKPSITGRAIEAAKAMDRHSGGNGEQANILKLLNDHALTMTNKADNASAELDGVRSSRLDKIEVTFRDTSNEWKWSSRIDAAGDYLRIIKGR